jgi:alpha-ribazole phosphatase
VIALRHTRPAVEGICYGRSEVPLAQGFEAEATRIATELPPVGRVVTSPRARCRRLAERIAGSRGLTLVEDARIAEMDFGDWEGRPWAEIARKELDAWAANFDSARPHGGESVAMLAARVGAALGATAPGPPPDLWVTHAGVVRACCALLGLPDGWQTRVDFGTWIDFASPPRISGC